MQTCCKLFQSTLVDVKDKIEPVLRSATNKDSINTNQKDDNKKHEESKSRWEKDVKLNVKEELPDDVLNITDIYKIKDEVNEEKN